MRVRGGCVRELASMGHAHIPNQRQQGFHRRLKRTGAIFPTGDGKRSYCLLGDWLFCFEAILFLI